MNIAILIDVLEDIPEAHIHGPCARLPVPSGSCSLLLPRQRKLLARRAKSTLEVRDKPLDRRRTSRMYDKRRKQVTRSSAIAERPCVASCC